MTTNGEGEDDKFLPEGKKKMSEVTNSNAYIGFRELILVQKIGLSGIK